MMITVLVTILVIYLLLCIHRVCLNIYYMRIVRKNNEFIRDMIKGKK